MTLKLDGQLWDKIHQKGKDAVTCKRKKRFKKYIKKLVKKIPCDKCKNHLKEFLSQEPLTKYFNLYDRNTGEDIGIFRWTWLYHNDVNSKLDKPVVSWDQAYKKYYSCPILGNPINYF